MTHNPMEQLETKVAFLERAGAELSDEVYRQRREIEELRAHLTALAERVGAAAGGAGDGATQFERPPHY